MHTIERQPDGKWDVLFIDEGFAYTVEPSLTQEQAINLCSALNGGMTPAALHLVGMELAAIHDVIEQLALDVRGRG
jgi:hypothetical protein